MQDSTGAATTNHALRTHPIDELISESLRIRLAQLDPLLNLDRLAPMIAKQRQTCGPTRAA